MSADAIVACKASNVDVEDELRSLGLPIVEGLFRHWQAIVGGRLKIGKLQVYRSFEGVPVFLASIDNKLAFYIVETEADGSCRVVALLAAVHPSQGSFDVYQAHLIDRLAAHLSP